MARGESTAETAPLGSVARLVRLGVNEASHEAALRIVLVNLIALGSLVGCVVWLVVQLALGGGMSLATLALLFSLTLVLVLQNNGHNVVAAVALVLTGPLAYAAWRWSGGALDGDHLFLLISIFLTCAVFPLRHRWTALALALFVFATYVGWVLAAEPSGRLAGGSYTQGLSALRDLILVGILALIGYRARAINYAAEDAVDAERRYADGLIRSVLPEQVARALKRREQLLAQRYPDVSVIYVEIDGFRGLCETLEPEALVALLDRLNARFDRLCADHGVERVKSSGPLYIAAVGALPPRPDHAELAAAFALQLRAELEALDIEGLEGQGEPTSLALRMGIDSGPLVAGAVGQRKYSYDVWGPTVDTAQALERSCVPGRVHISAQTQAKIQHRYTCELEIGSASLARSARRYWLVAERERAARSVRGRVLSPSEESWSG